MQMNKKYKCLFILAAFIFLIGIVFLLNQKKDEDNENVLYSVSFGKTRIKFKSYDYALGQNQIVGVEKSVDNGKNYQKVTIEPIIVSMEPKFVFLNESLGFAIAKENLIKSNQYLGFKVT